MRMCLVRNFDVNLNLKVHFKFRVNLISNSEWDTKNCTKAVNLTVMCV